MKRVAARAAAMCDGRMSGMSAAVMRWSGRLVYAVVVV